MAAAIAVKIGKANIVNNVPGTLKININHSNGGGLSEQWTSVNGQDGGRGRGSPDSLAPDGATGSSSPPQPDGSPPSHSGERELPAPIQMTGTDGDRSPETTPQGTQGEQPASLQGHAPVTVDRSADNYMTVGREHDGVLNEDSSEDPTAMSELKNSCLGDDTGELPDSQTDPSEQFSVDDLDVGLGGRSDQHTDHRQLPNDGDVNDSAYHTTELKHVALSGQNTDPNLVTDGPELTPLSSPSPAEGAMPIPYALYGSTTGQIVLFPPDSSSAQSVLDNGARQQASRGSVGLTENGSDSTHRTVPTVEEDERLSVTANSGDVENRLPEHSAGSFETVREDTTPPCLLSLASAPRSLQTDGGGEGGCEERRSCGGEEFVFFHREQLIPDDDNRLVPLSVLEVKLNHAVLEEGQQEGVLPGGSTQLVQMRWMGYRNFHLSQWKATLKLDTSYPSQKQNFIKHLCGIILHFDIECLKKVTKRLNLQHSVFLDSLSWDGGLVAHLGPADPDLQESCMKSPEREAIQSVLQELGAGCGVDWDWQEPALLEEEDTEDGRLPDRLEGEGQLSPLTSSDLLPSGQQTTSSAASGEGAQGSSSSQAVVSSGEFSAQNSSSEGDDGKASVIVMQQLFDRIADEIFRRQNQKESEGQQQLKQELMSCLASDIKKLEQTVQSFQCDVEKHQSADCFKQETADKCHEEMTQSMKQMEEKLQDHRETIEEMKRAARRLEEERAAADQEVKQQIAAMEEKLKVMEERSSQAQQDHAQVVEEKLKVMEERNSQAQQDHTQVVEEKLKVMEERSSQAQQDHVQVVEKLKVMEERNSQAQQDHAQVVEKLKVMEERNSQAQQDHAHVVEETVSKTQLVMEELSKHREQFNEMQREMVQQRQQQEHLLAVLRRREGPVGGGLVREDSDEELGAVGGAARNRFSSALAESERTTSKMKGKDEEMGSNQLQEKIHPMGTAADSFGDASKLSGIPVHSGTEAAGDERLANNDVTSAIVSAESGARSKTTTQKQPQSDAVDRGNGSASSSPVSGRKLFSGGREGNQERTADSTSSAHPEGEFQKAEDFLDWIQFSRSTTSKDQHMTLLKHVSAALKEESSPAPRAKCLDTILCIDVSESIVSEGHLETVKRVALDFVDGIEDLMNEMDMEENIAVVAVGGHARVVQHLTNDLTLVREAVDSLDDISGGRSPFLQALMVCLAANKGRGGTVNVAGVYKVRPRLIFITDGCPTDESQETGPDLPGNVSETRMSLVHLLTQFKSKRRKTVPRPITWVPIGHRADQTLMKSMAELTGGEVVMPGGIQSLCRYYKVQQTIGRLLKVVMNNGDNFHEDDKAKELLEAIASNTLTPGEKEYVLDAVKTLQKHPEEEEEEPDAVDFHKVFEDEVKLKNGELLALGTRVVRGPHWKWQNQDTDGPGTVIQHSKRDKWMYVKWDNGIQNAYRYGEGDKIDVVETQHHPRQMSPDSDTLDYGVRVIRGPDWMRENEDGRGPGTVIRWRETDGKVKVRWDITGKIYEYNFNKVNGREVQINLPEFPRHGHSIGQSSSDTTEQPYDDKTIPMWKWRDERRQWRLYDKATNVKLEMEYQKRPKASCVITRAGKDRRVSFKLLQEKTVDGGAYVEVTREMVDEEKKNDLLAIEMSFQD